MFKTLFLLFLLLIIGCAQKPYPWEYHLDEMEKEVAPSAATTEMFNAYVKTFIPKMRFFYSEENKLWIAIAPASPSQYRWKKLNNRVFTSRDGIAFTQESSRARNLNEETALPYFVKSKVEAAYDDHELFYCSNAYSDEHREIVVSKTQPTAYSFTLIGFEDEYEYKRIKAPPNIQFRSMPITMVKRNLLVRPHSNQYFLMEQRKYPFHPELMRALDLQEYHLLIGPPDQLYPFYADCLSIEGRHYEDEIRFSIKCALGTLIADEKTDSYQWTELDKVVHSKKVYKTINLKKIQPYDYYLKRHGQFTQVGWIE